MNQKALDAGGARRRALTCLPPKDEQTGEEEKTDDRSEKKKRRDVLKVRPGKRKSCERDTEARKTTTEYDKTI